MWVFCSDLCNGRLCVRLSLRAHSGWCEGRPHAQDALPLRLAGAVEGRRSSWCAPFRRSGDPVSPIGHTEKYFASGW